MRKTKYTARKRGKSERKEYFGYLPRGSKEFAEAVVQRWDEGQRRFAADPINERNQRIHALYYARDPNTGEPVGDELVQGGASGELLFAQVNETRALINQQLTEATATPPNWSPLATNTDTSVMEAVRASRSALEHYRLHAGLEHSMYWTAESTLVLSAGWLHAPWDPQAGSETGVAEDGETLIYEGDFSFTARSFYDAVAEPHAKNPNDPAWVIVRSAENRYDLAAQYPDYREAILEKARLFDTAFEGDDDAQLDEDESCDTCHVLHVYFARRPGMPAGREAIVLNGETVLIDMYGTTTVVEEEEQEGPDGEVITVSVEHEVTLGLSYDAIPVFRLAQGDVILESRTYADSHDLILPNLLFHSALGALVTSIAQKRDLLMKMAGTALNEVQTEPYRVLEYEGEKPEVARLFGPDAADFQAVEFCRAIGERQAVISPAQRGESKSGDSGSKTAFVASSSQSFAAGFGRKVSDLWARVGTHIIRTLATHATTERVISLCGLENQQEVLRFTGETLKVISRVQVHPSNAALDSPTGRVETAFKLLQMSPPGSMTIQQVLQMARGGTFDLADETDFDERMKIKREGEYFKTGKGHMVVLSKWDHHPKHIKEHIADFHDMDPQAQAQARAELEQHIEQHKLSMTPGTKLFDAYALLMNGIEALPLLDPFTGQPLPPPGGAANQNGGAPGVPGVPGQPPPGAPGVPAPPQGPPGSPRAPDQPGGSGGPAAVQMPQPPINPATGQRAPMAAPPQMPVQARTAQG